MRWESGDVGVGESIRMVVEEIVGENVVDAEGTGVGAAVGHSEGSAVGVVG